MNDIHELYSIFLQHRIISTDSRAVKPGSVFFALKGDRFDGNEYASLALDTGAAFAVIDDSRFQRDKRCLLVDDVLDTLQRLANHHRVRLGLKVIAITGSNGKTTTKELLSAVLRKKFNTLATKGNLNNHIGVPLTLLQLTEEHQLAVIEMGANHQGEIARLCEIAAPDLGIITNIGKAHLEGFGGIEGVKKGKGELYDYLKNHSGAAFVNSDSETLVGMASGLKTITYGVGEYAWCHGKTIDSPMYLKVKCSVKEEKDFTGVEIFSGMEINTHLTGSYNFENVLAAVCAGSWFGVPAEKIKEAIEGYVPDNNRSQLVEKGSNLIVLDAYNANPSSMEAALDNFALLDKSKKVVILGDMMELGSESGSEHIRIVEKLGRMKFDKVILVGELFGKCRDKIPCDYFTSSTELKQWLTRQVFSDTAFLIKGSRKVMLEKAAEAIA